MLPIAPADAWVIVSDRLGDARQAIVIADAIGVPYCIKHAIPRGGSVLYKSAPRRHASELLDHGRSSTFDPPWPRFMLTVGNWPAAVALAVKQQSADRVPIVLIGRPKPGQFDRFNAIVVASQYRIPDHPAVIRMTFPPHIHQHASAEYPPSIAENITQLRSPLTAVFVGGPTAPFRFDAQVARVLADRLTEMYRHDGGALYVVTSPRTPKLVIRVLRERVPPETRVFDWSTDAPELNPYLALLAQADRFVVTGDSASMLVEAAARHRPLAIFELPYRRNLGTLSSIARSWLAGDSGRITGFTLMALHRFRIGGFSRDLRVLHEALFVRGLATRFGAEPFKQPESMLPEEIQDVGGRIRRALNITLGHACQLSTSTDDLSYGATVR